MVQLVALNEFLIMKPPFYASHNQFNSRVTALKAFLLGRKGRKELNYTAY